MGLLIDVWLVLKGEIDPGSPLLERLMDFVSLNGIIVFTETVSDSLPHMTCEPFINIMYLGNAYLSIHPEGCILRCNDRAGRPWIVLG